MPSELMLSVFMITYNHEEFIAKAIDSIIQQKVNFEYEIVIGEDCSTDSTRVVINEYIKRFPNKIKLITSDMNVGPMENQHRTLQACKGKYIAILEGDDYWTNPEKIQIQVEFLEQNQTYSMCFTNNTVINENGEILKTEEIPIQYQRDLTHFEILANDYYICTCTALIRKRALYEPLPNEMLRATNGDYFIYSMVTSYGPVKYLNIVSGAYRLHSSGVWTSASQELKYFRMYNTFKLVSKVFKSFEERRALKKNLVGIVKNIYWVKLKGNKTKLVAWIFKSFVICLRYNIVYSWVSINYELISLYIKNKSADRIKG